MPWAGRDFTAKCRATCIRGLAQSVNRLHHADDFGPSIFLLSFHATQLYRKSPTHDNVCQGFSAAPSEVRTVACRTPRLPALERATASPRNIRLRSVEYSFDLPRALPTPTPAPPSHQRTTSVRTLPRAGSIQELQLTAPQAATAVFLANRPSPLARSLDSVRSDTRSLRLRSRETPPPARPFYLFHHLGSQRADRIVSGGRQTRHDGVCGKPDDWSEGRSGRTGVIAVASLLPPRAGTYLVGRGFCANSVTGHSGVPCCAPVAPPSQSSAGAQPHKGPRGSGGRSPCQTCFSGFWAVELQARFAVPVPIA